MIDPGFYHQLGNNDQIRCLNLLKEGRGAGVILSPRDIKNDNLFVDYTNKYKSTNTEVLIDPQLYTSDSAQLRLNDDEIDNTAAWIDREVSDPLIRSSMQKQYNLLPSRYIIPSPFATSITDTWLNILKNCVFEALQWRYDLKIQSEIYATLAISVNIITDKELRLKLLDSISGLSVDGFYLVTDIPVRPSNPQMLVGLMDIIFHLKSNSFKILLGYTEPYAILNFPLGLDGFASSGLKNRRSFQPSQWKKTVTSGGQAPKFFNFWSPVLLDSIRFPDEAEELQRAGLWTQIYSLSPYAERLDNKSPKALFDEKEMTKTDIANNYSVMMVEIAKRFRNSNYVERTEIVREMISSAKAMRERISRQGIAIRDSYPPYDAWSEAFEFYLKSMRDDLTDEYG